MEETLWTNVKGRGGRIYNETGSKGEQSTVRGEYIEIDEGMMRKVEKRMKDIETPGLKGMPKELLKEFLQDA